MNKRHKSALGIHLVDTELKHSGNGYLQWVWETACGR